MRPLLIKVIATVLVLAAGTALALYMLHRLENPQHQFATYQQMQDSGLIQAGWMPDVLPASAFNISHTHNTSTRAVRIAFQYAPGDTERSRTACDKTDAAAGHDAGIEALVLRCRYGMLVLQDDGQGRYLSHGD